MCLSPKTRAPLPFSWKDFIGDFSTGDKRILKVAMVKVPSWDGILRITFFHSNSRTERAWHVGVVSPSDDGMIGAYFRFAPWWRVGSKNYAVNCGGNLYGKYTEKYTAQT